MIDSSASVSTRLTRVEKRLHCTRAVLGGVLLLAGAVFVAGAGDPGAKSAVSPEVRTRKVVVVDEKGAERILIGAPIPDPKDGQRSQESVGMVINDADGWEQFAVGVRADGTVSMGFDAKPGVGDPRNRERVNLVVSPQGVPVLRMLANDTGVRVWLYVDEDGTAVLEFLDWTKEGATGTVTGTRKIGYEMDRTSKPGD